jgi:predicted Ser/Thr protein kinase
MEDLSGKQLGIYRIVAPLGEGGMAAVYKAYQPGMDRYVALKILPRHFASDPQFVARFKQEAQVLAKLQHPHILPVFDFGEAEGYTYIVMPFIESGTLIDLLKGQPLPLQKIRRIVSQLGDALDYAHSRGLVHRDVKPSNVLLDERGNCLLTDFGLAKIVEGSMNLTTSGAVLGTPAYMSPEQGLGQTPDGRSDIYSLGVILYEMATGRAPFKAETPMAVMIKHIHDPLPMPTSINPKLIDPVERVILKAMAKEPADRYATASEIVQAIHEAIPEGMEEATSVGDAATGASASTQTVASPARHMRSILWRSALGWSIAIVIGLIFSGANPVLGGIVLGALGGLTVGIVWRWIDPSLSRKRRFLLIGFWALAGLITSAGGWWVLIGPAVGGFLTSQLMCRAERAMTRWQMLWITLGWVFSWFITALMIAGGVAANQVVGGVAALCGIPLGGALGSWIMFHQLFSARRRAA